MSEQTALIDIQDVSIVLGGSRIVSQANARINEQELVMISGSNGAGKTTLAKAVLGLVPISEGSITVLGHPVGSYGWRRRRKKVGYVHQEQVLVDFPITAEEVVEIGLSAPGNRRRQKKSIVRRSMEAAGCTHVAHGCYRTLSGGERQRVAIARCLCQEPDILILDEATANLDPEGKEAFMALVEQLNSREGITAVLITHDRSSFQRPGWRRIVMDDGRMVP